MPAAAEPDRSGGPPGPRGRVTGRYRQGGAVELVPGHPGTGRAEPARRQRHRVPVPEGESLRHRRVRREHPAHRRAVQAPAEPEQPGALGRDRCATRGQPGHGLPQWNVRGQLGRVYLGEAATDHERGRAVRQGLVPQRVHSGHPGPGSGQQLHRFGVAERERRPAGHRHHRPLRHRIRARWRPRLNHERRRRTGRREHGIEVHRRSHQVSEGPDRGERLGLPLHHWYQPEVAGRGGHRVVPAQHPEHRGTDLVERVPQDRLVPLRADPVEDHAGQPDPAAVGPETVYQRGY